MIRALVVGIALLSVAPDASAFDYKIGNIEIDRPWSRATPKGAKVASGYLRITNRGSAPDRLIGGTFAQSRAVEVHEMSVERGVMKMRELKGGLEINPGATVELKPGALHFMFTDLARALAKGERIKGTLVFEKAGSVDVEYAVEAIGATPTGGHTGH
jgi:periplasmic copper chaperone A